MVRYIGDVDYEGNIDFTDATVTGLPASGGASIFEATVGATGADYTTLGAAITDGKVRILVIDDTTETGNITLPSDCIIQGFGINATKIDMSTNTLTIDNYNLILNLAVIGPVLVTGSDSKLDNVKAGATAGGGSYTITVDSGSSNVDILYCRGDVQISDSGTDTTIIGWRTY